MSTPAYERMGAFYMGKKVTGADGALTEELVLYDAKDLTTHAMCVGMTGSGKTGLCIGMLEEAAIDGVPAIAIDPKGDLGNLLLTFPKLRPEDFEPWVDEGQASRRGMTVPEFAKKTATTWKEGLASWGQTPDRIQRFRDAVDISIYTPGSHAGRPLTVLRSFNAPPEAMREDRDAMRERVTSAVSGLLALLGIDADPLQSREHILLSNVLDRAWREGKDLSLANLIQAIQQPDFDRIGVLDLDSFFPAKDRFGLAMTLNNLLASPGFAPWLEGEPLDIGKLLYTDEGKPRLSVLSIAHLSDSERMFFVTLLLNELVGWMRAQAGTTSLRALLYMDEVFGYLPPSKNPPSKTPMLTLLKQARAYGLGVMLATQNPVDLDYKALSNMGTWFLGRLQTERDKARILDGLEGATASANRAFDRKKLEATLSGLKSRVFLMNNVHEDEPVLFQTRWVLSYLRGPLTRKQIQTLMKDAPKGDTSQTTKAGGAPESGTASPNAASVASKPEKVKAKDRKAPSRPILPPGIDESFVLRQGSKGRDAEIVYRPALFATARLHFVDARKGVDIWQDHHALARLDGDDDVPSDPWDDTSPIVEPFDTEDQPEDGARFARLPSDASKKRPYTSWKTRLKAHVYRTVALPRWRCRELEAWSEPSVDQRDFRAQLAQELREKRDLEITKVRERFASKAEKLEERVRKAKQRVEKEQAQYEHAKRGSWLKMGETILGAVLGRKKVGVGTIGKAGTAAGRMGQASKEKQDVEQAVENLEELQDELKELEVEFEDALEEAKNKYDVDAIEIESAPIKPRKSDIEVSPVELLWLPWVVDADGIAEPAF